MNTLLKKKVLLLDQDGIITNFDPYILELYTKRFNADIDWKSPGKYLGDFQILREDLIDLKLFESILEEPNFFIDLPLIKGAKKSITELNKYFDIYIVTSPILTPFCCYEKQIWINTHFPFLQDKVIITSNKELIKGDIFIDDRMQNIERWKKNNPKGLTGTLDYNWTNREVTDKIFKNWEEIEKFLIEDYR